MLSKKKDFSLKLSKLLNIMKLRLSKRMYATLIAALAVLGSSFAYAVEDVIDVGLVDTTVVGAQHGKIDVSKEAAYQENGVTVGTGQAIGAFTTDGEGNKKLITSFGAYTFDASTTPDTITGSGSVVTNHLAVNKLTVSGTGQVYLGGQVKIVAGSGDDGKYYSKKDAYSGLIAGSVVINGEEKDGKPTTTNLDVQTATIDNLIVNSGRANIHYTGASGGNSGAVTVGNDCKITYIKKSIEVNGGVLNLGYSSKAQTGQYHYLSHLAGTITQTNGTFNLYGQSQLGSGVTITQSGGTFDAGYALNGPHELMLTGGINNLNQVNPEEGAPTGSTPEFTIRRLVAKNASYFKTKAFNITQTADKGIINLTAGTSVTSNYGFKLTETSTLKQDSKEGVINIGGNFSEAVYDVEQSGTGSINILSGCKFTAASVDLTSTAQINVLGNLSITGDMAFTALSNDSAAIVMGSGGNLTISGTESEVSLTISLADVSMYNSMVTAALENEGGTFTIDLISELSGADVNELQGLIDSGALTLGVNVELLAASPVMTLAADTETTLLYPGVNIASVTGSALQVVDGKLQAVVSVTVPEPTTATLSLLALAALASRRRRK